MSFEVDHGLEWDQRRQLWVTEDGFNYDGARFGNGLQPENMIEAAVATKRNLLDIEEGQE